MKLFCTAERSKQLHDPHCEPTNLYSPIREKKPEKSTGAMLNQVIFLGSIFPMKEIVERINEIIIAELLQCLCLYCWYINNVSLFTFLYCHHHLVANT